VAKSATLRGAFAFSHCEMRHRSRAPPFAIQSNGTPTMITNAESLGGFEPLTPPDERQILGDNEVWSVYEMLSSGADHDRPSLIFASAKIARRVRTFPANWRELTDGELYEISHLR
jgi:hypothetical protein